MVAGWVALMTALIYLCALFAVAHFGENRGSRILSGAARPLIYRFPFFF